MVVDQYINVTAVANEGFEVHAVTTTCGPGIVAIEGSRRATRHAHVHHADPGGSGDE